MTNKHPQMASKAWKLEEREGRGCCLVANKSLLPGMGKKLVADNNAIICQQQSNYLCITEQLLVKNKQLFFHSNAIICYFAMAMQSFSPYNATHLSTTMQQVKRYKIIAKLLVSR